MTRMKLSALAAAAAMMALAVPAAIAAGNAVPVQVAQQQGGEQQNEDQPQGTLTDAEVLAAVQAQLPDGVTLATATPDQLAAAINAAMGAQGDTGGQTGGGQFSISQVLAVVSVVLDSLGRGDVATTVTTQVIATLPPDQRQQVQTAVQQARNDPTPSQLAAAANVVAGQTPAAGTPQGSTSILGLGTPGGAPPGDTGGGATGNPPENPATTGGGSTNPVNTGGGGSVSPS
jgi:hypothetical protein